MEDVMNVAFLGLGGNDGDRLANIQRSIHLIELRCGKVIRISKMYETEAWGTSSEKLYVNCVLELATPLEAPSLMENLLLIEKEMGRLRTDNRYGDRTIDLDLLFFNELIIHSESLSVPHPRLHLRKFVLVPLAEIAPDHIHPELHLPIQELLASSLDTLDVKPLKVD